LPVSTVRRDAAIRLQLGANRTRHRPVRSVEDDPTRPRSVAAQRAITRHSAASLNSGGGPYAAPVKAALWHTYERNMLGHFR